MAKACCFNTLTLISLVLSLHLTRGQLSETPVFDSISKCCSLGSYRAKAQVILGIHIFYFELACSKVDEACDGIKVPVKDIIPEMQATCLSTLEVCCTKTRLELQCEAGRRAALNGEECSLRAEQGSAVEGREAFKDCCLACTLGIVVASMGQKCSGVANIFGCPLEKPFVDCCEEIAAPLFNDTTVEDNDVCPEGFKYNAEMHVCDDLDEVRWKGINTKTQSLLLFSV